MCKVSVIIPTFNYARFIGKALDGVLCQTYKDYEIIVVDDGSTDDTGSIILGNYGDNVSYFYQNNKGAPIARNRGFKESNGDYLVFLDADDYFAPSFLEETVKVLDISKDIGWVYTIWVYVDEGGIPKRELSDAEFAFKKKLRGRIFKEMLSGTLLCSSGVLVRRECIEEVGGFDPSLEAFQDHDLWLRVAYHYNIEFINKILVYRVVHDGSISKTASPYPSKSIINRKIENNYSKYIKDTKFPWKKIQAAEFNYWGNEYLKRGDILKAVTQFAISIRRYPYQKKVYALLVKAMLKKAKLL